MQTIKVQDNLAYTSLGIFVFVCATITRHIGVIPGWDMTSYIAMAENPVAMTYLGHHGQRIFGPFLVWLVTQILPLTIEQGFRLWAAVGTFAAMAILYKMMRAYQVNPLVALVTALFSYLCFWPLGYGLSNVYQLTDTFCYPLVLILIWSTHKEHDRTTFALSLLGIIVRQNLLVLSLCCYGVMFLRGQKQRALVYGITTLVLFALAVRIAGMGISPETKQDTDWMWVYRVMYEALTPLYVWNGFKSWLIGTKFPLMLSPFTLALLHPTTWAFIKKYWWTTPFVLVTVFIHPIFYYDLNGADNSWRYMMPALYPLFVPAGVIIASTFKSRWLLALYSISPILYGTIHLSYLEYTWPPLLGHRFVVMMLFGAIVFFVQRRCRHERLVESP